MIFNYLFSWYLKEYIESERGLANLDSENHQILRGIMMIRHSIILCAWSSLPIAANSRQCVDIN